MKVMLVVHQFFPRHQTGTEVCTRALARELNKRHRVTLFYREHEVDQTKGSSATLHEERTIVEGLDVLRVRRLGPRPRSPFRVFRDYYHNRDIEEAFERLLEEVSPDIVHIQHLMYLSGGIIDAAVKRDIPVVVTLHDYWFICPNAQLIRPDSKICRGTAFHLECTVCAGAPLGQAMPILFSPVLSLLFFHRDRYLRSKLAKAELFLSPSHFLKQRHVAQGFPEERILLVENGIDLSRVIPRKERDGASPTRFGYLGSIAWQKGVHLLVEAFNQMPEGAELMIYGDLSLFPGYVQGLRKLARNPAIHFRGHIPHQQVWQVLSEIDILVVPSLWYENSPMVILEAFAAGVPVIASRIGALAEKVRDGIDGLHFAAGDAGDLRAKMLSIVSNSERLESLQRNIKSVSSIQKTALEIERIYQQLLHERQEEHVSSGV